MDELRTPQLIPDPSPVRLRTQRFTATGDIRLLTDQAAEDEATELLEAVLQESFRGDIIAYFHLRALHEVATLYWLRLLMADGSARDEVLAVAPVADVTPTAVPAPLLRALAAGASPGGGPQVGLWIDLAGRLVRDPALGDRLGLLGATIILQVGVVLSPADEDQLRCLGYLVTTLKTLHRLRPDPVALQLAIEVAGNAVARSTPADPDHAEHLGGLADVLRLSFEDTGDIARLTEAIRIQRLAVAAMPAANDRRIALANNLGSLLRLRHDATGDSSASAEDAAIFRDLAGRVPPGHEDYDRVLSNYGEALMRRPDGDENALDEAIELARTSLRRAKIGTAGWANAAEALSNRLVRRSRRTGSEAELDEAIGLARQVAAGHGDDAGFGPSALINSLLLRYDRGADPGVLDEAIGVARRAVRDTGIEISRVDHLLVLGKLLNNKYFDHGRPDDATEAIDVLRQVRSSPAASIPERVESAWLSANLCVSHRDPEGAADDFAAAVELLGLLADKALLIPDRERHLRKFLTLPTTAATAALTAGRVERAAELVERGRGALFENPAAMTAAEMAAVAAAGPIVIPLLGPDRSDALIVTAGGIRHVPLPTLTWDLFRQHALALALGPPAPDGQGAIFDGLAWLWDAVAEPVLDELGFLAPAAQPRRMWWCSAGALGLLPLHAAGLRGRPGVLDLTISSYAPTVRSLRGSVPFRPSAADRALLVGLPSTPGMGDLPGVERELAMLAGQLPHGRLLRGAGATRAAVLAALPDFDIAHFACHGGIDMNRSGEGFLVLHDGPLGLSAIAESRRRTPALAYLSACSTASMRLDLPEESLSLAAAFRLAGFTEVVGTRWPIADHTALQVTQRFYAELLGGRVPAAQALRSATLVLREQYPAEPARWAPYMHVGP